MNIIAYLYSDPLLEPAPDPAIWGWEVDRVYQDLGGRAYLAQLLCDCSPGDYLLIRRLEELGSSVGEIRANLAELESRGIDIIVAEGQGLQSPQALDLIKLLGEIQQSMRSRSIRKGHARNRIKALPPPGKAPYGYRRSRDRYSIDRSTAPVVKDFFDRFLLYGSLRGAVRYLEQKYGKKISVTTGRRWLANPVYRGDLAYQKGETIPNTHAPIISREEAAQVDRLLRRNRVLPPRTASAPRSLAGLVACSQCQSAMTITRTTVRGKKREYLYLRPIDCPKQPKCKAIPYQEILEQTIERVCQDLPIAVAGLETTQMSQIKEGIARAIAAKQEIIAGLPSLESTGILDSETASLRAYKLRTEIAELESKLAQLPPVNLRETAQAVSLPQFWLDLSESERRFYFREFIRQVQIVRPDKSSQDNSSQDKPHQDKPNRDKSSEDNFWHIRVVFIF
ncbi:MAG: recombinase family protein [Oscillatoria sp. SIO1A7]|nr:recombinase family protein [Oscillatoria sp. SIO1A7]